MDGEKNQNQNQEQEKEDMKRCLQGCFPRKLVPDRSSSSDLPHPIPSSASSSIRPLPYLHVDSHLFGLSGQAEGFGFQAIGGLHGQIYHVTSLADDGDGSLRMACKSKKPLWIIFDVSGVIMLSSAIKVQSFKTIDGRGQRIKLMGNGLQLRECEHVIICNLEFEGGRGHDVDGIQLKPNSKHVWIDRCSLSDYDDGLIDITRQCTEITVSRCYFYNHDKTMLIGADPSHVGDRCIRVTIHHCFFDGTRQRHPRVRFGKVHLYNNYTRNWGIYAVCASVEAQILSQCNVYEAGKNKKAFEYYFEKASDKEVQDSGSICSQGDIFLNGAVGVERNPETVFRAEAHSLKSTIISAHDLAPVVQTIVGWQNVPRPPHQIA